MNTESKIPGLIAVLAFPVTAFCTPCRTRIRFADEKTAVKGFGVLRRSGYVSEVLGEDTYGLSSACPLALLREAGCAFEVVT